MKKNCFLCKPDHELIVWETDLLVALVGLGPITQSYFVVGTKAHVRSFADASQDTAILAELDEIRRLLTEKKVPLLLTENGRVPVCRNDGTEHEEHCFHAHVLLFDSPDICPLANSYFGKNMKFDNSSEAFSYAAMNEPYHLVSPAEDGYTVFTRPLNVPRQLFRGLVAHVTGDDGSADWQSYPRYEQAKRMAEETRQRIGG